MPNNSDATPPVLDLEETKSERQDDCALHIVGVGIHPELQQHVFELFFQSQDGLARSHGGMGVGLTLVRDLVNLHGGSITVYSQGANTGCTMTVCLPLTQQRPVSATPEEENVPMENLLILIVEDNKDSREMFAQLLRLDDYEVLEAGDGVQGYDMIEKHKPDLAFVDVGLPRMNGHDLARKVTAAGLPTVLVALTGYGRDEDRRAVLDSGFTLHLVKPLTPERLYETLKEFSAKKVKSG